MINDETRGMTEYKTAMRLMTLLSQLNESKGGRQNNTSNYKYRKWGKLKVDQENEAKGKRMSVQSPKNRRNAKSRRLWREVKGTLSSELKIYFEYL